MARTIRRQPATLSHGDVQQHFFNQTQFTGINIGGNETTVDSQSFEDAKNLYVSNGTLISRAPFLFFDNTVNAILQWTFGVYKLVLYRYIYVESENGKGQVLSKLTSTDYTSYKNNAYVVYTLRCVSHELEDTEGRRSQYHVQLKMSYLGKDYEEFLTNYYDLVPSVSCQQIEEKVFIWFAGADLRMFNTAGTPYFTGAADYIYIPIHKSIINGIKNTLEDKNVLTDAYLERYVYAADSYVDFNKIQNKEFRVSLSNENTEQYLYDYKITLQNKSLLIYPKAYIGENYTISSVHTARGTIVLKQYSTSASVSFDGRTFRELPSTGDAELRRLLTEDGRCVVSFGRKNIYFCLIVADTTDKLSFIDKFVWRAVPYYVDTHKGANWAEVSYSIYVSEDFPEDFVFGHFQSESTYTYFARLTQEQHTESGVSKIYTGYYCVSMIDGSTKTLDTSVFNNTLSNELPGSIYHQRVNEKYVNFYSCPVVNFIDPEGYIAYDSAACFVYRTQNPSNTSEYLYKMICFTPAGSTVQEIMSVQKRTAYDIPLDNCALNINPDTLAFEVCMTNGVWDTDTATGMFKFYGYRISRSNDTWSTRNVASYTKPSGLTKYNFEQASNNLKVKRVDNEHYLWNVGLIKISMSSSTLYEAPAVKDIDYGQMMPISGFVLGDDTVVSYYINGELWTSALDTARLNLDQYVNVSTPSQGEPTISLSTLVPDKHVILNEHYLSFYDIETGKYLLNVTETKLDERRLEDGDTSRLLYIPKRNEQVFSEKITALHPLSDELVGIFTANDIWYISLVTLTSGAIGYTRPVKSKVPAGCRDGDDVITAYDGQTIIFATQRGIAALAPQDFIATTEKTITYLTENIYSKYYEFYTKSDDNYLPMIRIGSYKQFLLFYRYMQREILILDTQANTWWLWETSYPIMSITSDTQLKVLMYVDYIKKDALALQGIEFVYADMIHDLDYIDDIIPMTTDGTFIKRFDIKQMLPAKSTIDWHFVSHRLDFGQFNNYKGIKGINLNVKDAKQFCAKLMNKVWRDTSVNECDDTLEFDIKDLKTFVTRLNLWQVVSFQYTLQSTESDTPYQLKLNSLSVKYEIKGRVR